MTDLNTMRLLDKLITTVSLAIIMAGCNTPANKTNDMDHKAIQPAGKERPAVDTTPKVNGIGGIFFFSDNVAEIKAWYGKNLGLEISEYGSTFEFRNANRPDEINYLQWSLFKKGSKYFAPSKKEFMINYRVQNIE